MADVRKLLELQKAAATIIGGVDAMINETADSRRSSPLQHVAIDMAVVRESPVEVDLRGTSLSAFFDFGQGRQAWGGDGIKLWLNSPGGDPILCPPSHAHNGVDLDDVYFDKLFIENTTALAGCTLHLYAGWGTTIRYRGGRWYTTYSVTLIAPGFTASNEIVLPPSIERCILLVPNTAGVRCWLEVSPDVPGIDWYRFACPMRMFGADIIECFYLLFRAVGRNVSVDLTPWISGLNNCSVRVGSDGTAAALTFQFHVRGLYL